jgi:hypothetical protein
VVAILGQAATMWRSAAWLLEREYAERYGRPRMHRQRERNLASIKALLEG